MDRAELLWRAVAGARTLVDRGVASIAAPRWDRRSLTPALVDTRELQRVRAALEQRRWMDAHHALAEHFAGASRFVINASAREGLAETIRTAFPGSVDEAASRAH